MYVVILTYKAPLEKVMQQLPAHLTYLDKHFAAGDFIAAGRQNPLTGGIILCRGMRRETIERILADDPFQTVADFKIIEFSPDKHASGMEKFLSA